LFNLREVVNLLQHLENPVIVCSHGIHFPVFWFNQLVLQVFRWYVIYLKFINISYILIYLSNIANKVVF